MATTSRLAACSPVDRLDAQLREVGQRVGARAPERRRDEDEQEQVAGRPPDRQPEHVDAAGEDEPGDAEERGGREYSPLIADALSTGPTTREAT